MEDLDGFEVFDHYWKKSGTPKQAWVTLQQRGNLSLNIHAFELIGSPEFVLLLFDRAHQRIGIRAVESTHGHRIPVKEVSSHYHAIASKAFTNEYGIDTSIAYRYIAEMQDGMLVIDLNGERQQVTSPRAKKALYDA